VGPRAGLDGGKSRLTGIRSPDLPARSQSLYRLSYLAHSSGLGDVYLVSVVFVLHLLSVFHRHTL
jgi:hypothetical protein